MLGEVVGGGDGQEGGDEQGAGATHASVGWQVADEGDVATVELAGEVAGPSSGDGHGVIGPMAHGGLQVRADGEAGPLVGFGGDDVDELVGSGATENNKALLDGADQAATAGVISVFAETLDAAGDEEGSDLFGRFGVDTGQGRLGSPQQLGFAFGLELAHAG